MTSSPGHCGGYSRLGRDADAVNGQLLLVNVVIILENVTQIPDLNINITRDNMTLTALTLMLLSREEVITQLSRPEVRGITSRIRWKWAEITLTRLSVSSAQM